MAGIIKNAQNQASQFLKKMPFKPVMDLQAMTGSPTKALPQLQQQNLGKMVGDLGKLIDKVKPTALSKKVQQPQDRRAKGSMPVATKTDGSVLYSDGTVKHTPLSNRLNTLKANVLSQQNFQKQAEEYLGSIALDYQAKPGSFGTHTFTPTGPTGKGTHRISISPEVFQHGQSPALPAEVLTHEYLHAMDANVSDWDNARVNYTPVGDKSGDSFDFYHEFQGAESPKIKRGIRGFLSNYPKEDYVYDQESFAQYAAPRGNRVLLGPLKNRYSQIFVPATKAVNSSPVYPTNELYQSILKELQKSDEF